MDLTHSNVVSGTFSVVYKAHPVNDASNLVALKRIRKTSSPARIERELHFLQELNGQEFVRPPLTSPSN